MFAIKFALLLILAYLIGSFPTGVLVGKLFYHKDIRDYGSHNIGTTNTFRVLGPKAGTWSSWLTSSRGPWPPACPGSSTWVTTTCA